MRHLIGVLAATAASLAAAGPASSQTAPAKPAPLGMIRDLVPATVQLLGTVLYSQDRQSWLATELLTDAKVDLAPIIGWINAPYGEGSRVRFIKDGSSGPFAAYDVVFEASTRPALAVARDPTLTPIELTQWRALNAALALKINHCSERPANHVEVQLPGSGEWLVWILAPWETPKALPVGGHTRVTVSPDGARVLLREALSRGCQTVDPTPPSGAAATGLPVSQQVANVPVETHVFNALQTGRPMLVSTPDGATWRVDGKSVSQIELAKAPPIPAPSPRPSVAVAAPARSGSPAARPSGSPRPTASPPVRLRGSVSSR